jgi:hypothetical protein
VIRWGRLRARLTETFAFAVRPGVSSTAPALRGLLSGADASDKTAVLIGQSGGLADLLGLKKCRFLALEHPDFILENLALLSDEYDFVIADRTLHLCGSVDDAAHETMRVLKPGGWYVQTTGLCDFALRAGFDARRLSPARLRALFPHAVETASGRAGALIWTAGRKASDEPTLAATIATRKARRPWYRFRPRPAKFGVVTMMRNEAPYLLEWIAYHRLLGFGQITIYDNESNDASPRILGPLARAGIINAVYWRDRPTKQDRAFTHAGRRLRRLVEWCLFIDLDEFLVLKPGLSLDDLLPKESEVSALAICWRVFGSSGLRNRGTEPVMERFLKAGTQDSRVVKTMARLRDVSIMSVHLPRFIKGRVTDLEGRTLERVHGNSIEWQTDGPARLHHYQNRSWEEFECKRARGFGAAVGHFIRPEYFDRTGTGAAVVDDALRFVPAVKEEIARLRRIVGVT